VEDVLIAFGKRWLSQRGVKFAQSLLPQAELAHAQPLLRHGFHHVTTLLHLDKDLTLADRHSDETPRLRCQAFDQCDAGIFKKVLLDSYEKTLDCPELNDLRTADEIIAGYRQMPGCRVEDWYLVWVDGQPVGVLILVPGVEPGAREMAYLGLTLAARGKGLGAAITLWAMDQTRAAGDSRMTLSVDARNAPARRLYAALGFREFESREVILAVLAKP
jgi:GNAT superfamily N-acetyltransferase